jgi:hypothetical protein
VLVDDLPHFQVDSICSVKTRLRTLGVARSDSKAVLRLLLTCAPLPDAVTNDVSIGGTVVRRSGVVL